MKTMHLCLRLLSLCLCGAVAAPLHAADPPVTISEGFQFAEQDGEGLYRAICQGCHMPQGQGAQGAGHYPALAANPRLASGRYIVLSVVHGRKGMPAFGRMLNDAQIAEVANYVRTHMGNQYPEPVTVADVKAIR